MSLYVSTVTQKGQITIPHHVRKALNIKPKDRVAFEVVNGQAWLRPIESSLLAGFGSVEPLSRPEDFRKLRREIEEEIAEEVMKEA